MKTRKITSLVAMFAFLCAIIILPAKIVKAEGTINLGQQITVKANTYEEYQISLKKGSIVYLQSSVSKQTSTNTKYGYSTVYCNNDVEARLSDRGHYEWNDNDDYYGTYVPGKVHQFYNNEGSNGTYYIKEDGVYTVTVSNYHSKDATFAVVDGTQILSKSVSKPNTVGNNVYEFKPVLSGVYAFTVKSATNKQISWGDICVSSFDGTKEVGINTNNDKNVVYTDAYDSYSFSCTLKAGVTYYIYGTAHEAIAYTNSYGNPDSASSDTGYTLSITQSPTVSVPRVAIKKVTSPKTKTAKVTWKRAKGVNGYAVSYSTKKNLKGAKTVYVSYKGAAKVIKKLKKNKKYYVAVRAYRVVEGNRYFGAFSKILKVKTK